MGFPQNLIQNFMKFHPVGAVLIHAYRQTDVTKVTGSSCNYAVKLKLHFVRSIFIYFALFLQSKAVTELSSINQLIFVMKKKGAFCDVGTTGC
jgi:hypothetical protein